ncbi:hypothetical protein OB920_10850 [Halobacteria archaeon HArc-gm2]|nr:hypothetical protein [Halobacteria archaeon HArc-gm2]
MVVTKFEFVLISVFLFTAIMGFVDAPYLSPADGVLILVLGIVLLVANRLV